MLFLALNKVGSVTAVCNASIAINKIFLLKILSCCKGKDGSPAGYVKSPPKTILFVPTERAIDVKAVICTLVMPNRSSSFEIVAPQRVHVPHVDVSIAALIPFDVNIFAIS